MKTSGIIQKPVLHTFSAQPRAVKSGITRTLTKPTETVILKKLYTDIEKENINIEGRILLLEERFAGCSRRIEELTLRLIDQQG